MEAGALVAGVHSSPHADGLKLTLTKDDFQWEFFTAGGHGGQKQNKTSSACRCSHKPSGSTGISRDERSQPQNKRLAFERCTGTEQFKRWAQNELAKQEQRLLDRPSVEQQVNAEMMPGNLRVEIQDSAGNWIQEGARS